MSAGRIHIGIGGWTFEPWRGTFYPEKLAQAKELAFAGERLTAIEINATYYSTQKPESWQKWADAVPGDFVFTVKASRFCTNRRVLAEGADSIAKFLGQGMARLGDRLGPILWQFMATKKFDREDMAAFLKLLPGKLGDRTLRHALEVRHESFVDPAFVDLARDHGAAIVFADHAEYPAIADLTADFAYARLQQSEEQESAGYAPAALDRWAAVAKGWAAGEAPDGLHYVATASPKLAARDVYIFFISGAKVRNPAAAQALIDRVS
ncbi:Uncharacterized conserved protein YecE, DUF72 family [Sphingomonas laterariae]|uniref:Uncharacterized conserved protein YecE, DUF72 family n=1 Tax=Edaphosphingomonas laterariae TaxID=861865 RepID=A0A239HPK8_9SPHN|nr:DUF72 domain-containing protein [Sphingomonas laterariae]SNS82214.1 Uncharacterized conserved protein YecE, DUF72 family [Sphingomonas laterariae]